MSISYSNLQEIDRRVKSAVNRTEKNSERILTLLEQNLAVSQGILTQLSRSRLSGPEQDIFKRINP